ncbi:hypothetical protein [Marasmitruncus massiliensis]|uniref:hypothetical protein n=1 Tax=Marasmitruncus massiliensis TaxID=1944642 RepID=UPI000C7A2016|nr:hypothetical protein [Marasmitruncus massiliensis]
MPGTGNIREKWVHCGNGYNEFYIYAKSDTDPPTKRNKHYRESRPAQQNLNDKYARRYFIRLVYGNFYWKDYHISATYDEENLPKTWEQAVRDGANYIKRIARRCKKLGLPPPKCLGIIECYDKIGKPCRVHHHILVSCGLTREELESLWHKKGMKKGETIGFVNADRIRNSKDSIERLARYISKYPDKADDIEDAQELDELHRRPRGRRRWYSSGDLIRPFETYADTKYKPREFGKMLDRYRDRDFWEETYPGYQYIGCTREHSDLSGWCICLKMQKMTC